MSDYERRITIPRELRLAENIFDLRIDKLDLTHADGCVFDFSKCTFGEPFPLLLLADKIKHLVKRFPGKKYKLIAGKDDFHTFADHIGFFRYIGWPRGRKPGEAWGSKGYIPIELFDVREFQRRAGSGPIGSLINDEASRLATVLSQADEGATFDVLQYAIREIMRNAAEHSFGTRFSIMGQYWPTRHEAEIVIIDDGVGVPNNLYDNEYVECNNPREALKFALLPGISGVSLEDRIEQDHFWGNSGFGLFVTSRICSANGLFRIISGSQGITLVRGTQVEHDWHLDGTCVQMRLNVKRANLLKNAIAEIIEEGESQRAGLLQNFPIQASAASKMLASQFEKRVP